MKQIALFFYILLVSAHARGIFVAVDGNDATGDGSLSFPYRTVAKASTATAPGDTVYIRGGVYNQKEYYIIAEGTASQPIVFIAYGNEQPIFDGAGISMGSTESLFRFRDCSYVEANGIEVRNSTGRGFSYYESEHVVIRNCKVHHNQYRGIGGGGHYVLIDSNEVYQNCLINEDEAMGGGGGWPGAIASTTRADGSRSRCFSVRNNVVYENWGEAIIALHADTAEVVGNTIRDGYSNNIYVDHSQHVLVANNFIRNLDPRYMRKAKGGTAYGVALAVENTDNPYYALDDVKIINNLIMNTGRGISYWHDSNNPDTSNTYRNILIAHNVIKNSEDYALRAFLVDAGHTPPANVRVYNNIIYSGKNGKAVDIENPEAWTFGHNIWPDGVPTCAQEPNSFAMNPGCQDTSLTAAPLGYKLYPHSMAVGRGCSVDVTGDFRGNPRPATSPCIGIHELGNYVNVAVKLFLQGPFVTSNMNLHPDMPLASPYGNDPLYLHHRLDSRPEHISDWVSLSLRISPDGADIATTSGLLRRDGWIVADNGADVVARFGDVAEGSYYIVARHRNHGAVLSATAVALTRATAQTCDLSLQANIYGHSAAPLTEGICGLWAGDCNGDGFIQTQDYVLWHRDWLTAAVGYLAGDFDFEGTADLADFMLWQTNARQGVATAPELR